MDKRRIVLLGATGFTGQRVLSELLARGEAPTLVGRTDPYEMTGSLLAWGASHAAAPDAALTPGVHGPVAAFGLLALRVGAAQAGLHEAGTTPPAEIAKA